MLERRLAALRQPQARAHNVMCLCDLRFYAILWDLDQEMLGS